MKILYNGELSPCNISVNGILFKRWAKNEIRDIADDLAIKLVQDNKSFKVVLVKKQKDKKNQNNL